MKTLYTLPNRMAKYSGSLPESLARHIDDLPSHPAGHWYGGQPYYDIDGQIRIGHLIPYEPLSRDGSVFKAAILALSLYAAFGLVGLTVYWIVKLLERIL